MILEPDDAKRISASVFRLTSTAPFFAALTRYARFEASLLIPTAATDGSAIYWNPSFLRGLSRAERDAVLLHEVLHCALLHVTRRGMRDPHVWNIACDIVVNSMIAADGQLTLPTGHIRSEQLERYSVEEIYALLLKQESTLELPAADLLEHAPSDAVGSGDGPSNPEPSDAALRSTHNRHAQLETHWRSAMRRAVALSSAGHAMLPVGLKRELHQLEASKLNWRALLARFLIRTPADFTGFDRRFLHQKIYLDALEGERVQTFVCMDTSGSIDNAQMTALYSEVQAVLRAYPQVNCELFFADTELYGPHVIRPRDPLPIAQGGGGTDFTPFFDYLSQRRLSDDAVAIYLTDGYGRFPIKKPRIPVLWIVTPGGLETERFAFGTIVRLL